MGVNQSPNHQSKQNGGWDVVNIRKTKQGQDLGVG